MSLNIRLKHSATKDKKPQAADLKAGELALNTNSASAAGYALDDAGAVQQMFGKATETQQGQAEIASQAEVDSGTDDERIITPTKLAQRLNDFKNNDVDAAITAQATQTTADVKVETDARVAAISAETTARAAADALKLDKTGGALTGPLTVPAGATGSAVPRSSEVVKISGDTMTGGLTTTKLAVHRAGVAEALVTHDGGNYPIFGVSDGTTALHVNNSKPFLSLGSSADGAAPLFGGCDTAHIPSVRYMVRGTWTNAISFNWDTAAGSGINAWIDSHHPLALVHSNHRFYLSWSGGAMYATVDGVVAALIGTPSDYRIKKNIEPASKGIETIKKLKPCVYSIKETKIHELEVEENNDRLHGFVAHELAEVVPDAVVGAKDDPGKVQTVSPMPVVSVLTKALQEAVERIESLEGEVKALKASRKRTK